MPEFSIIPTPHEEAAALIKGKPAVTRAVFDAILPEIRGRVFTITGVEGANVLERVRDLIAKVPQGTNWEDARADIIGELETFLGEGAERRAELLLRTHGFQAFQASNWRVAQEDEDTTHLQYLATEDDRVRESHLALNGVILPKTDPFWATHFPPWEWGCRCRTRPMNPDLVDLERANDLNRSPDDQLVIEGPALNRLRDGALIREGKTVDVTAPKDRGRENAYEWNPDTMRLDADGLRNAMDPAAWDAFQRYAVANEISPGVSLADWLQGAPPMRFESRTGDPIRQSPITDLIRAEGPRTGQAFARERAAAIRAAESATEQQEPSNQITEADQKWAPRKVTQQEIEEHAAELEQLFGESVRVPSVEEILKEIKSGNITGSLPPAVQRSLAEIERAEKKDLADLFAQRSLYKMEHPGGPAFQSEAIARWFLQRSKQIQEQYVKLRRNVL